MQYTVVHSKDPYLLARLATDLQMSGVKDKDQNQIGYNDVFIAYYSESFYTGKPAYHFHADPCNREGRTVELTSRNYIKVLTQILEP